jgi:hypothetical protein
MNAGDLAHLSGFTVDGPVWPRCTRCGTTECLRPDGGDVPVSDLAIWVRDHVCPGEPVRMLAREAAIA